VPKQRHIPARRYVKLQYFVSLRFSCSHPRYRRLCLPTWCLLRSLCIHVVSVSGRHFSTHTIASYLSKLCSIMHPRLTRLLCASRWQFGAEAMPSGIHVPTLSNGRPHRLSAMDGQCIPVHIVQSMSSGGIMPRQRSHQLRSWLLFRWREPLRVMSQRQFLHRRHAASVCARHFFHGRDVNLRSMPGGDVLPRRHAALLHRHRQLFCYGRRVGLQRRSSTRSLCCSDAVVPMPCWFIHTSLWLQHMLTMSYQHLLPCIWHERPIAMPLFQRGSGGCPL